MQLLQLIGPLLVLQGVVLGSRLRRAPLRPPPADADPFAVGLAILGGLMSCAVAVIAAQAEQLFALALSLGAALVALAWVPRAWRRHAGERPHVRDLRRVAHEAVETVGARTVKARLLDAGMVGGVEWPEGTLLAFRADGSIARAVPTETVRIDGLALAAGEPIVVRSDGRLAEIALAEPTPIGRLPRGPSELRGVELWAQPRTTVQVGALRAITLAHDHVVQGVELPAGSVVDADRVAGTVRVRLARDATVHGHAVPEGSVLRFPPARGVRALFGAEPALDVELGDHATEGYRDPSGRRRLQIVRGERGGA